MIDLALTLNKIKFQ